jgi:small redox-active disulfide protein 2
MIIFMECIKMKKIAILGTGCPKCRKLYEMAEETAKSMGIEYQMEKVDDIVKIMEYGVMMTPALVIDGEIKFSGKLPSQEELKKYLS